MPVGDVNTSADADGSTTILCATRYISYYGVAYATSTFTN